MNSMRWRTHGTHGHAIIRLLFWLRSVISSEFKSLHRLYRNQGTHLPKKLEQFLIHFFKSSNLEPCDNNDDIREILPSAPKNLQDWSQTEIRSKLTGKTPVDLLNFETYPGDLKSASHSHGDGPRYTSTKTFLLARQNLLLSVVLARKPQGTCI
jgi:hypothetical protein